jgi:hypothetical protein
MSITRRSFLEGALAGAALSATAVMSSSARAADGVLERTIPATGEKIAAVGLGTWITFNVGADPVLREECAAVMAAFFAGGGRMIDSSPMYGSSQAVVGHGLGKLGRPPALFAADKVWTSSASGGPAQIEASRAAWACRRSISCRCTTSSPGRRISTRWRS